MRFGKSLAASVAALGLLALAAPANAVRYDAVVDGQFAAGLPFLQTIQIIWQINSDAPGAVLSENPISSSLSGKARQGRSGAVNATVLLPQSQNFDLGLSGDSTGRAVEGIYFSDQGYSYQDTSLYIARNPDGGGYQRELFVNFNYTNNSSAGTLSDINIRTPDSDIFYDQDVNVKSSGTFRYIITDYDRFGNPTPHVIYDFLFIIDHISFHAIPTVPDPPAATVPEPGTWALMIAGFGLAGTALRRRRRAAEQHAG